MIEVKTNPSVSVIITTYNRACLVGRAIQSVLSQIYKDFEIIVVDDGSTDNTEEVLKSFSDGKIRYIHHKKNLGGYAAFITGLKIAKGEYIAILDDDDFWMDGDKLKRQVEFLNASPEYVLVGTNIVATDEKGIELFHCIYPGKDNEIRDRLLVQNCFAHSSVVYRKRAAMKLGGYDRVDDYELWLRLGTVGKLANIPICGVKYLFAPKGNIFQLALEELKLINKYRHNYPNYWKAIWFRCVQAPFLFIGKLIKGKRL